nr:PepSY domain-containing protein [uncultured Rhodopila sp.]
MSPPTRRVLIGLSLIAASLRFAWPARAQQDDDQAEHRLDHDSARHAVEHGEALPLSEIFARVRRELGGEVAGVAFRRKASRWIYEFRVIAPNGRLGDVYVDAATAEIIERESH